MNRKKRILSFGINMFVYFFVSGSEFETAIFSETIFQTSPNYSNYLIYKGNLIFYIGEVLGKFRGRWGKYWGSLFCGAANFPKDQAIDF